MPETNDGVLETESNHTWYTWVMDTKTDKRTIDWLFVGSPWQPMLVLVTYLFIIFKGPKLMDGYTHFDLKRTIFAYNLSMVTLNLWIAHEVLAFVTRAKDFSLMCQAVDYSQKQLQLASAFWWYYISKYIELLDTVFFILRKRSRQVTFLHVYHHSAMPVFWWMVLRFIPGGSGWFSVWINSSVHVVMYTYYMLTVMAPPQRLIQACKNYITITQLTQFVAVIVHSSLVIYGDCGYPRAWMAVNVLYMISLFALFRNFYRKTYTPSRHQKVHNSPLTPADTVPLQRAPTLNHVHSCNQGEQADQQ